MILALAFGWVWVGFSSVFAQSSSTATLRTFDVFVDSRGDTIPSFPENLPFRIINGYPEYKIGPGDILEIITVEGNERKTTNARVQPDGTVSFSIINAINIRDLPLMIARDTLQHELGKFIRSPQLQVFVKDYNSRSAAVFGSINLNVGSEVAGSRSRGPGIYALKGRISALDLMMQAGGPTADARLDQVRLTRQNRTFLINLQVAITQGDTRQNVILEDGDVIQITGTQQADRRVAILGEVAQPGVANLSNQSNMLEAIAASEGFTAQAAANRVRIIRMTDINNPEIITVNANRILNGDLSQNISVQDGDIIIVPQAHMYSFGELLTELSPLIRFGGLLSTGPMVTLSGYNWNTPGANQQTATTGIGGVATTGLTTGTISTTLPQNATTRDFATEQQVIQQVQRNLTKPSAEEKQ